MAKDSYYFSHDYNARNDEKIKRLIRKHGMLGYGIFWAIIEDLYQNGNSLKLDFDLFSYEYRVDENIIKSIIMDFDLFKHDKDSFGSSSIESRMEIRNGKSQKASESAKSKWGTNPTNLLRSERLAEARKKGTHTKSQWEFMKGYFGECVKCESKIDLVKDHIKPIYQGGSDGIDNIQPLCRKCNSSKGADSTDWRPAYCERNACEMPAEFLKTPAIKESKVNESIINVTESEIITPESRAQISSTHLNEFQKLSIDECRKKYDVENVNLRNDLGAYLHIEPSEVIILHNNFDLMLKTKEPEKQYNDYTRHFSNWARKLPPDELKQKIKPVSAINSNRVVHYS